MDYPKIVNLDELRLEFKMLPIKISFKYGWTFLQKASSSVGQSLQKIDASNINKDIKLEEAVIKMLPAVGELINKVVNSFSDDDILSIINIHKPYISVVTDDDKITDLNIDYHFSGKPQLIVSLFVKILEVYYKDFFTGLPKLQEMKLKVKSIWEDEKKKEKK